VPLWGNNRVVGTSPEVFDLLWEGKSWLNAPIMLQVTRIDTKISRLAELLSAPPAAVRLVEYPAGSTTLTVRLRNLGSSPWRVGGSDVLGVFGARDRTALLRTGAWLSAQQATRLVANLSRKDTLVYPGEIGEWRVPITAINKAPGVYAGSLRAFETKSKIWYGPTAVTRVTVARGSFAGAFAGAKPNLVLPRAGSQLVWVDVRNSSNFSWQVGGPIRLAVLQKPGSPSRAASWLKPLRPSAITNNVTARALRVVRPGQTARFAFRVNGNGRKPGRYTEKFGVVWDGWKAAPVQVTVTYVVR
jgi:hypothetical protein